MLQRDQAVLAGDGVGTVVAGEHHHENLRAVEGGRGDRAAVRRRKRERGKGGAEGESVGVGEGHGLSVLCVGFP